MYFGSGIPKLNHGIKTLRGELDSTSDGWRDQVRADFEERHVEPFLSQATVTLRAMEQLSDVFARIHRDCSDTSRD